jgi:proteasome assembly chaperone (PAC2) family protein
MAAKTRMKYLRRPKLNEPVAVVGSPGLRSIGKLAIDLLVDKLQAELIAELYSTHFPIFFHTRASYAPHPMFPGDAGVKFGVNGIEFPRVKFYSTTFPELIITLGYHANFNGQYEVAEKVLDLFEEFGVKRMIVLAGYGRNGKEVCCAATSLKIIEEMGRKYGIEVGYEGPFYGFSGLVFGLAKLRGIEALCLFGRTEPNVEKPEYPDENAANVVLKRLTQILNLNFT